MLEFIYMLLLMLAIQQQQAEAEMMANILKAQSDASTAIISTIK